MIKWSVSAKIIIVMTNLIVLSSCFKSGSDLEPDPNMGKSKLSLSAVTGKTEAESAQFQISLNKKVAEDVVLSYSTESGTATSGVDFVPTSGSITIPEGSTTVLITIPVMDDALVEGDETINLVLSGEHNRINVLSNSAVATIIDDDTYPVASITDISNLENLSADFTVSLDKAYPENITIDYAFTDITAVNGTDYNISDGTLTIPAGNTSGIISVPLVDDTLDENDESFSISLSNPVNVSLNPAAMSATAIIDDDDGTPNLDVADTTAAEGNTITFTVSIPTASSLPISFDWATADAVALDTLDYTSASGTANIPAGSTSVTIDITGLDDALSENTETFNLSISNPTNAMLGDATGVASITDDDPLPSISIADVTIVENTNAVLTVSMSAIAGRDINFDWATADATATSTGNIDFTAVSTTTETISAGDTTATLTVTINDDSIDEPDETFTVNLSNPVDVTISDAAATVTVQDNDLPPSVDWSTASLTINEGQFGIASNRIQLSFNNSSRSENLVDFPVLVRLNGTRIDYSKTKNDGSDIRFVDSDGTTMLPYEIEKWDEAGESLVWVKVPQIDASSNTDHIYMYYGNLSLEDAQSPQDVWNDDYIGVYHLESINGEVKDSSKMQKHGTNNGALSQQGQIGNSVYFDGTRSISLGLNTHLPKGNAAVSVCAWSTQTNFNSGEMLFSSGTENGSDGLFLGSNSNYAWFGTFGSNNHRSLPTGISTNNWIYTCGAYSPGSSNIFVNGTLADTDSRNYNFQLGHMLMGSDPYPNDNTFVYAGNVDELRISKVRRSNDWINAEYASMNDSLIIYSVEESELNILTVTANLSGLSGYKIDIPYVISGTSTATDHNAIDGTLSIAAESGTSASFDILITNDQISEASETINIDFGTLVNASPGTVTQQVVTINDDEALPEVNFDVASKNVFEGQWWDSNWLSRSKISIDASSIASNLEAFPVLVKLNASNIDYAKTLNSGEDLRFVSPDATEVYPHEIEKWDETGDSFVWVRVPSITANTNDEYFYIYFNNSGAADGQNVAAVWDEHFNFVNHMNSLNDSTGFNLPVTEADTTSSSSNFIGDYKEFPLGNSHMSLDFAVNQPTEREERSMCAWAYGVPAGLTGNHHLFGTSHPNSLSYQNFTLYRTSDNVNVSVGGTQHTLFGRFKNQEWAYYCMSYDGSNVHYFVNGISQLFAVRTNIATKHGYTHISKYSTNTSESFKGSIDEVRFSNIHRGEDWFRAEYLSGTDQLLSFAAEEAYSASNSFSIKVISANTSVNNIDIPITITGTSSNPADHDLSSTTLTIPAGQLEVEQSFTVVNDSSVEGDETIVVTMGSPVNASAGATNIQTITIKDDDKDPILNFQLPAQTVAESAGLVNISLELNKQATGNVSIPYTITGTANNPADHDLVDGTATITTGNSSTTISVNIVDDSIDEWGEDITITLGAVTGASLGPIEKHRLYIEDNDLEPTISIDSPVAVENTGTIDFTVSLSQASEKDIEFDFETTDGTAKSIHPNKNFESQSFENVVIPAGNTTHTISITILDNNYDETDKNFNGVISDLWQATMGTDTGTATIQDDETSPVVNFNVASQDIDESEIWWDSDFNDRIKLTFKNQDASANLNNFPVLVKLNSSRIDYTKTKDAGEDIRFVDSDGITLLNYEIETWNEAGDSFVWVKVPQIDAGSGSDHIWLYYNNISATDNQNIQNVWNGDYQAVWHMNTNTNDSSSNSIYLNDFNTSDQTGVIGGAKGFTDAANSYLVANDSSKLQSTGNFYVESWIRPTATNTDEGIIFNIEDSFEWRLQQAATVNNQISWALHNGSWSWTGTGQGLNNGIWYHVVMMYDRSNGKVRHYIDAELVAEQDFSGSLSLQPTTPFYIGYRDQNTHDPNLNANIDEFRFVSTIHSEDWLKAQYKTQTDQFISFSNGALSVVVDVPSETDITVPYTVSGTATNPSDHNAASSSIVIPAYSKGASINFDVVDDAVSEADETLVFIMGAPTNATAGATTTHTATIKDDDGKSSITINDISMGENATTNITVSLSPSLGTSVSVDFSTQNLSALAGTDYTSSSGTITFAPGETSKTISVTTNDDSLDEYTEYFLVVLSNPTGDAKISDAAGRVSITDDDPLVDVQFSLASSGGSEATSSVSITASINTISAKNVQLPYTISGTSLNPADHDAADGFVRINAGQTSATISFDVSEDSLDEFDETIILTAGTPTNANLGTNTTHTYTITDNDAEPSVSITGVADTEGNDIALTATLSAVSGKNVSFDWSTSSATATKGVDFSSSQASGFIIPAGSTSISVGSVKTIDDAIYELPENFNIVATNLTNATAGASNLVTINDDETQPTIGFSNISVDVMESDNYIIEFDLGSVSTQNIDFDISLSGTATSAVDYNLVAGTKTIPAGNSRFSLEVQLVDDALTEGDETLIIDLSNPVNAILGTNTQLTITIKDAGQFSVSPVYAGNSNWGDYIENDDSLSEKWKQTNDPCTGIVLTKKDQCVHGAEYFMVDLGAGYPNCTNLSMKDALDMFVWTCDDSGANAVFYSTRLKTNRPLATILDTGLGSIRQNAAILSISGFQTEASNKSSWWTNTVSPLPDSSVSAQTLSSVSTIYYMNSDITSHGYFIDADKISIFGNGYNINADPGMIGNCLFPSGMAGAGATCILHTQARSYLHLESIRLNGPVNHGFLATEVRYSSFTEILINNAGDSFRIVDLEGVKISDSIASNATSGFYFENINRSNFQYLSSSNHQNDGFIIGNCNESSSVGLKSSNNSGNGLIIDGPTGVNCYYNQILASNNGQNGVYLDSGTNSALQSLTLTNNTVDGLHITAGSTEHTINNLVAANNGVNGIDHSTMSTANINFSQLVLLNNSLHGINLDSSNNHFTNNLLVGNNASDCNVGVSANAGMDNVTCSNNSSSNANLVGGLTSANSFVGKIATEDLINPSDANGSAAWSVNNLSPSFDSIYRAWGQTGSNFPSSSNQGTCSGGTCHIWDWSLQTSDTVLKNTSINGFNQNANVNAGACPAFVNGNISLNDFSGPENNAAAGGNDNSICEAGEVCAGKQWLTHATEILGDGFGNDDGFCETDEDCYINHNFGVYQGHGDESLAGEVCSFQNGSISNVRLFEKPNNGN